MGGNGQPALPQVDNRNQWCVDQGALSYVGAFESGDVGVGAFYKDHELPNASTHLSITSDSPHFLEGRRTRIVSVSSRTANQHIQNLGNVRKNCATLLRRTPSPGSTYLQQQCFTPALAFLYGARKAAVVIGNELHVFLLTRRWNYSKAGRNSKYANSGNFVFTSGVPLPCAWFGNYIDSLSAPLSLSSALSRIHRSAK